MINNKLIDFHDMALLIDNLEDLGYSVKIDPEKPYEIEIICHESENCVLFTFENNDYNSTVTTYPVDYDSGEINYSLKMTHKNIIIAFEVELGIY